MGCASSCTREPWKVFRDHPILKEYHVHHRLGAGAFSEVSFVVMKQSRQLPARTECSTKLVLLACCWRGRFHTAQLRTCHTVLPTAITLAIVAANPDGDMLYDATGPHERL
jgi:hypothetical protein